MQHHRCGKNARRAQVRKVGIQQREKINQKSLKVLSCVA